MAKTIKQIRFYGYNDPRNYPATISYNKLVNGEAFLGENEKAYKIGIQAPPGTKFTLGTGMEQGYYNIVGMTGIYELDLSNLGITVEGIQIYGASLDIINSNSSASLIVDIITDE